MLNYHIKNNDFNRTILFITGAGISSWMWAYQLDGLNGHRLVTFDLPGHGENSEVEFASISSVALEVISIMKKLNIKQVNLVGHSIGAQIILYLLEHNPECVESAIVISGFNQKMTWTNLMIKPMVGITMPLIKKRWFAKIQAKQLALPDQMFDDYFKGSQMISKITLINILKENMNFEFKGSTIEGKRVLFIVGDKEKKIMKKSTLKNNKLVKGSQIITLNAAHGIPYELPFVLNEIIEERIKLFL